MEVRTLQTFLMQKGFITQHFAIFTGHTTDFWGPSSEAAKAPIVLVAFPIIIDLLSSAIEVYGSP